MKVTVLGSGAALPDPDRAHSAYLITPEEGVHYLVDLGPGATRRIVEANVDPSEIKNIFLTHLHHDHCSELPYFVIATWMCNRVGSPHIYGPEGTADMVSHLFEGGAFKKDIEARSQYARRQENIEAVRPIVHEISSGLVYEDEHIRVTAGHVEHIPSDITHCFGFRFEGKNKTVVISSDTAPCDELEKLAQDADVLIMDCTFPTEAIEFRKKANIGTWAHTSPEDAGRIASRTGVKCLVPSHFAHFDNTSPVVRKYLKTHFPEGILGPELLDSVVKDIRKHYSGTLMLAHDLMRIDL